ncbi:MAG: hypothetical protein IKQ31_01120 [Clostridia bacterium]|nr:hypothetical protein [Clostridia bacterium]
MENPIKNHKLICENQKYLCLTGVEKTDTASPTHFSCVINGKRLNIVGKNLTVKKLDVAEGVVELEGDIEEIKYQDSKTPLIKRLFR